MNNPRFRKYNRKQIVFTINRRIVRRMDINSW